MKVHKDSRIVSVSFRTNKEMLSVFGKECAEYMPGCACCDAWHAYKLNQPVVCIVHKDDVMRMFKE